MTHHPFGLTRTPMTALPIDPILPDLVAALRAHGRAVLQAPPGAGKTTRVPLAMLDANLTGGRIIMLEPRRLATRAAAERLAETLGEPVGQTIGYRMRGESAVSKATRVEVVTEGILTRMIQSDPELTGIGAVIFDEFHERSLNADLGLALAWEIRAALRPDLILLVMSATLDAGPVATLLDDAPILTSEGRAFPVTTHHLPKALPKTTRLEQATADLIIQAVSETTGGVLVFLPGEGEIRRVESALSGRLPKDCAIRPLYGALPFAAQRAAIAPVKEGRKIVLSTSIAETSLTIADIRVVIDAGRSRRARFDPSSGMSRLVTEKVSRAEATQRAGRAGRVAEGACYKLWTKGEDGALPAFPPAEIEAADLAPLALELAQWGSDDLAFLTPPPEGTLAEARRLLTSLGALDKQHRITAHGRAIAALPTHPRLAHMLLTAGQQAAPLAALLAARDPLRGAPVDLALRIAVLKGRYDGAGQINHAAAAQIKAEIPRLSKGLPHVPPMPLSAMAALAWRWYRSGALGADAARETAFTEAFKPLLDTYVRETPVMILRDYHAENLLWLPARQGPARAGQLDFQDAMLGHPAYDLVSLLQDARRDVSSDVAEAMVRHYCHQTNSNHSDFTTAYHLLGAQRNLRILGVFARLSLMAGKPHYIDLIPRVWAHLMHDLAHPALAPVAALIRADLPEPTPALLQRLKDLCGTVPAP